jgi:hypothetical protein
MRNSSRIDGRRAALERMGLSSVRPNSISIALSGKIASSSSMSATIGRTSSIKGALLCLRNENRRAARLASGHDGGVAASCQFDHPIGLPRSEIVIGRHVRAGQIPGHGLDQNYVPGIKISKGL